MCTICLPIVISCYTYLQITKYLSEKVLKCDNFFKLGHTERDEILSSRNFKLLTSTKCYEHQATSDVKELLFPSPEITTTPKRRIQDIINMPSPNVDFSTPRKIKLKN
ncbi:Hypothetical protein CINCED_3A020389 [Cinara cedri]|uniref:Uncharacterized protein n=1 Tax=Cinara cedri TaxID=506608 RepID=A0A5E4N0L2_9HEMI|nr:Hypothetical protein CINCED_3A020389 [Cinara cedri]